MILMSTRTLPLAGHGPISRRVQFALIPDLLSFRTSAVPASKTCSVRDDCVTLTIETDGIRKRNKHVNACDKKMQSAISQQDSYHARSDTSIISAQNHQDIGKKRHLYQLGLPYKTGKFDMVYGILALVSIYRYRAPRERGAKISAFTRHENHVMGQRAILLL